MPEQALEIFLRLDWGEDTALWSEDYPIDMDALLLSDPLIADLHKLTGRFVSNTVQQGSFAWREGFDAAAFDMDASKLAKRVAGEVGLEFSVTYQSNSGMTETHRSMQSASNAQARSALKSWLLDSEGD